MQLINATAKPNPLPILKFSNEEETFIKKNSLTFTYFYPINYKLPNFIETLLMSLQKLVFFLL